MRRWTRRITSLFENEKAGGIVLIICTIVSLLLANSPAQIPYLHFWEVHIAGAHLVHWINDGLMAVFFLLIGLELRREIHSGELSDLKNALLPICGALGGMLVPAAIYLLISFGTPVQSGAGIPMATDIVFAISILTLLGNRVPASLKIFLTALAVIDDLGAILTIALFYSSGLSLLNLGIAAAIFGLLLLINRLRVRSLIPYLAGGILMWYFMLHSGIHATITGVLLAFTIPFGDGSDDTPAYTLQHVLHKPVAFFILPVFVAGNTCIPLAADGTAVWNAVNSIGIFAGLLIGKPLGIFLFSRMAVALDICRLPANLGWKHITGAGILGGIGFTMSIFITLLAFDDPAMITSSKLAIMVTSLAAAMAGLLWLRVTLKQNN